MEYPCDGNRCGWYPCRCEEIDFRYSMELGNALRDPYRPGDRDDDGGASSFVQVGG